MNKKTKETIYRTPPTKKFPKGARWRFLEASWPDCWLMARIKDGHRLFVDVKDLTIEK